jgi:transposase-like protein
VSASDRLSSRRRRTRGENTGVSFKEAHFEGAIILACVRGCLAYPLSYRHIEQMMEEHGIEVDHSTLHRWVVRVGPAAMFNKWPSRTGSARLRT